ncbi:MULTISPECIES: hypothetical protein [unclassified Polaromonas]|jgi:hypothetical protein|uniref:hypothetical protein n=1 Tax=unclassified Polaromonas TaxID=2638319 RepID=UPI000BCB6F55|nr:MULTISPECIES: hypothetical protein [unclassified Polaromonas]OYY34751.1 MAG: hypothetical protein B7Y60_15020 [Polaromonas sp. 35-63-35]OYZ19364.1 MAG: hypothetical protein B7Y28_12570 [Polaromonas sp. 16-63-31]OYZ77510.1 MAG: hypothetical protein B7Y09_16170 [Polaromonas sp. 24-63-21]OZA48505.1 MAG: hypothetical protein B7X88_18340 [Polaromonas sp. 17-63-33]OZA87255.1 MAG: hypothetical protein B7X65_13820 [Polaromonas sp. 39-63-25]
MSTDRELLELAAKAAGIGRGHWDYDYVRNLGHMVTPSMMWNPLENDGEAMRLAVLKRFTIKDFAPFDNPEIAQAPPDATLWGMVEIWIQDGNDPVYVEWYKAGADRFAATRRAIVRAAAEIGEAMT